MSNRVRTKGNVKPSNSERASRLLASNQLVSFSQASKTLSSVYGTSQNDSVSAFDCDMSSDFQNVFKHMGKKDINTKIKALEDFMVLCATKDQNELMKISRYWFRIYRKLANAIEFNIRHLAHAAQSTFISMFDREVIVHHIENQSVGINEMNNNEISFQNLITMPAVIWTSCFDDYPQPRLAAIKNFEYLYRVSGDSKNLIIDFLLRNYESILNYCVYIIFKKIPIELFYTTMLPPDSVRMFEEHQLTICLSGITSMIQDLNKSRVDNTGDSKNDHVIECLETLFLRLNSEFVKCKGLDIDQSQSLDKQLDESEKAMMENCELEMSKKEKKRLKRKMMENQQSKNQSTKKTCDYWKCSTSTNINVRAAFYHNLTTLARITTYFADPNGEGVDNFEKLNISTRLWYKLYKKNFYESIFNAFVDSAPEIKGLCWLIGSHLLRNAHIYDPWSVINCDDWLNKILKPFIINGMRTAGTIVDFGLQTIDLKNAVQHKEFHETKHEHLSAWKILSSKYEEMDIHHKVRLVITFIESFNRNGQCDYKIHRFFLENLFAAFGNVVLSNDSYFLVELYFNICLMTMRKCLEASKTGNNEEETRQTISLVTEQVYRLLEKTLLEEKGALLWKSQVNLNHLLFVHKTKEFYLKICHSELEYDLKLLSENYKLFESSMEIAYQKLLSHFSVHRQGILRFLTESYFHADHYFSPDYFFCDRGKVDYEKNMWKILQKNIGFVVLKETEKQENFQKLETFDKIALITNNLEGELPEVWLVNPDYDINFDRSITLSLFDVMPKFTESTVSTISKLMDHIDSMFQEHCSRKLEEDSNDSYQKVLLPLFHLQYIFRPFSAAQLQNFDGSLFIQKRLLDWIQKIHSYSLGFSLDDDSGEKSLKKFLNCVHLEEKIFEIFIIFNSKSENLFWEASKQFVSKLDPLITKIVFAHLLKLEKMPLSPNHRNNVVEFKTVINQYVDDDFDQYSRKITKLIGTLLDNRQRSIGLMTFHRSFSLIFGKINLETKLKFIFEMAELVGDSFQKLENQKLLNEKICAEFPPIMMQFYSILMDNSTAVEKERKFHEILVQHINLILEKIIFLLTTGQGGMDENARFFCKNAFHQFLKPVYFRLMQTNDCDLIFTRLLEVNINLMIDKIIFHEKMIINTFDAIKFIDSIIGIIAQNCKLSLKGRPGTFSAIKAVDLLMHIPERLKERFLKQSSKFKQNFDLSYLFNLYYDQHDPLFQIYQVLHIQRNKVLQNSEDCQKVFKLNWKIIEDNLKFVEMNLLVGQIVNTLLTDLYCLECSTIEGDDNSSEESETNSEWDLMRPFLPALSVDTELFIILKQFYQNHYLLQYFHKVLSKMNPYKLCTINSDRDKTIDVYEFRQMKNRFQEFSEDYRKLLISIIMKFFPNTMECSMIFLNETDSITKTDHHLLYYSMGKFFKELELEFNSVENQELPFQSEMKLVELSKSPDTNAIIEVLKSIANIEQNKDGLVLNNFESFVSMPKETIFEFLTTSNIQLAICGDFQDMKTLMLTILRGLSACDFVQSLSLIQLPSVSSMKLEYSNQTMLASFFKKITIYIEDFDLASFQMFITFFKNWITMIFAMLEEEYMSFDVVILSTRIIEALSSFIKSFQNSRWLTEQKTETGNQEKIEIIECIKNFCAYHSLNFLLPLFVNFSDLFENKILYNELARQFSNCLCLIDLECMEDISMFVLNQSLLMYNDDSVLERRFRSLVSDYEPNLTNYLRTENEYHNFLMDHVTPLLLSNEFSVVICAYHLISTTISSADWKTDTQAMLISSSTSSDMNNELTISGLDSQNNEKNRCYPPKILVRLMKNIYKINEEEPFRSVVFKESYLFVFSIYLRLLARYPYNEADNERRLDLINYLMEENLHEEFLNYLFIYLEPNHNDDNDYVDKEKYLEDVIVSFIDGMPPKSTIAKLDQLENYSSKITELFPPVYGYHLDEPDSRYLSIFLYYQALSYIPNAVRCWFNKLKHVEKAMVDRVTKKYFTKLLIEKEIENINKADKDKLGNINLKYSKQSNEIIANYSFKEIRFGIKFIFKENYPLTPVSIDCFNKSGVSEDVCRKWLHRLTIFFNKLNCPIMDGIIMIKPNMDKFFEGIEECMICLFALYGANGQLPRFKCPQCKKKFHTICVRKWFQTSNVASCPQCKFEFQS